MNVLPSQDTWYRSIINPVGFGFWSLGSAMVRKAETVPWVRTGSITRAQVNINLSAEWSTPVVRESLW